MASDSNTKITQRPINVFQENLVYTDTFSIASRAITKFTSNASKFPGQFNNKLIVFSLLFVWTGAMACGNCSVWEKKFLPQQWSRPRTRGMARGKQGVQNILLVPTWRGNKSIRPICSIMSYSKFANKTKLWSEKIFRDFFQIEKVWR